MPNEREQFDTISIRSSTSTKRSKSAASWSRIVRSSVEDPLREEQFRTQLPKLRLMTSVALAPGEEWGTRADFSPLVEQRDI